MTVHPVAVAALAELAIIAGVALVLLGAKGLATTADILVALLAVLFLADSAAWPMLRRPPRRERGTR